MLKMEAPSVNGVPSTSRPYLTHYVDDILMKCQASHLKIQTIWG